MTMTPPLLDSGDGGRRLWRLTHGGATVAVVVAADELTAQRTLARHGIAADTATDAGHADRTEVTSWGLTDRV